LLFYSVTSLQWCVGERYTLAAAFFFFLLWYTLLPLSPTSDPVSFMLHRRQYYRLVCGMIGNIVRN